MQHLRVFVKPSQARFLSLSKIWASQLSSLSKNGTMASQSVSFPSENKKGDCVGVVAGNPSATTKGLIVLQEMWGMNQQIQNCGRQLSQDGGFYTLVPDLYRGKVTDDREEARHFMGGLDWEGAVADVQGAARYLQSKGMKKIGVTGFCMGGALAIAAAALVPEIDAAVPFYGIPPSDLCDPTSIKVPLQCHFALRDATVGFASPDEWKPFKAKIQGRVKTLEFYEYDVGHAFANSVSPNYDEEACKQAFARMLRFLKTHMAS